MEYMTIWMIPQKREKYSSVSLNVANKMSKLVSRGYIVELVILTLESFFMCPKEQMIYVWCLMQP